MCIRDRVRRSYYSTALGKGRGVPKRHTLGTKHRNHNISPGRFLREKSFVLSPVFPYYCGVTDDDLQMCRNVAGDKALSADRERRGCSEAFAVGCIAEHKSASEKESCDTSETTVSREGHFSQRSQGVR